MIRMVEQGALMAHQCTMYLTVIFSCIPLMFITIDPERLRTNSDVFDIIEKLSVDGHLFRAQRTLHLALMRLVPVLKAL